MKIKFIIIIAFLIIPIGAWFDAYFIENTNFIGYLLICFIEAMIFITGILVGRITRDEELTQKVSEVGEKCV